MICISCGHTVLMHESHETQRSCINYLNGLLEKTSFQTHSKEEDKGKIANLETEIEGFKDAAEISYSTIVSLNKEINELRSNNKKLDGIIESLNADKKEWRKKIDELEKEADKINDELIEAKKLSKS